MENSNNYYANTEELSDFANAVGKALRKMADSCCETMEAVTEAIRLTTKSIEELMARINSRESLEELLQELMEEKFDDINQQKYKPILSVPLPPHTKYTAKLWRKNRALFRPSMKTKCCNIHNMQRRTFYELF